MEANARKVFELYRMADELPLHMAPEEWANAIQKFRVPARDFKRKGDEQFLLAALDAYGPALGAVNAFTEMLAAQVNVTEPVVEVSVPPTPLKADAPVESSSPSYGTIDIPVMLLDAHVANPRLKMNERTIEGLTEQMRVNGFDRHHPVLVRKKGNRWEIIGGHHRVEAAIAAGLTVVPCQVVEQTDAEAMLSLASDNTHATLTNLEHGLHSIKAEEHGIKVKDYAAQCGLLAPNLSRYRNGARVFLAVRTHLSNDDVIILAKKAEHLAALEEADPAEWPMMVRAMLEEAWSLARTRKEVALLTAPTQKEGPQSVESPPEPVNNKAKTDDPPADKPSPRPSIAKAREVGSSAPLSVPLATFLSKVGPMAGEYVTTALLVKTFLDAAPDLAARTQREHVVRGLFEKLPDVEPFLQMESEELAILALVKLGVLVESAFKAA